MADTTRTDELLAASPLFSLLPDEIVALVREQLEPVDVDAGEWLMRKGDPGDALYIVDTGRLEVVLGEHDDIEPEDDEGVRVLRVLGRGSTVGELALVTGDPRSASVRATRDSSLFRLSYDDFHSLLNDSPAFGHALVKVLGRQLQSSGGFPGDAPPPRTMAFIPLQEEMNVELVAEVVRHAFGPLQDVAVLDQHTAEQGSPEGWGHALDALEQEHDRVLLVAQSTDTPWRRFCVRQADRLVCVTRPEMPPHDRPMPRLKGCDLVLAGPEQPAEIADAWLDRLQPRARHRIWSTPDDASEADVARAARRVVGRSLGLVLGGGGARGYAHLGVLEVLEESGIPVDRVGGTSMGGIVASLFAYGLDAEQRRHAAAALFSPRVRHRYQVPPRSALARTDGAEELMDKVFGDAMIETLPIDLFTVAADLVNAEMVVQRRGRVADAAMSTARIPAILPPGRDDGRLLVDGGLIRNLPVGVMADMNEGPVVAVEVGGRFEPEVGDDGLPELPGVGETLMRSVLLGSAAMGEAVTSRADLLIEPEVSGIKMLAFQEIDKAVEVGRRAAEENLDAIRALLG
ncbi:MAG: patatin-like phospholipase family protein [Acidobacteria bacterium]|nr:patatin-like phospholipase family protein [Acidobacteriota bacterium]